MTEFVAGGPLDQYLESGKELDWPLRLKIAKDIGMPVHCSLAFLALDLYSRLILYLSLSTRSQGLRIHAQQLATGHASRHQIAQYSGASTRNTHATHDTHDTHMTHSCVSFIIDAYF